MVLIVGPFPPVELISSVYKSCRTGPSVQNKLLHVRRLHSMLAATHLEYSGHIDHFNKFINTHNALITEC